MSSRNQLNRRTLVQGSIGAAVTATALSTTLSPAPALATQASGEVSFMNWDVVAGTPLEAALNAFQEQSGIKVNVQPTPTQDYETKQRTLLASGSPPDIMRVNDDLVRAFSVADQLYDLKPFIDQSGLDPAEFQEYPFTFPVQPDGKHTAWPIGTRPYVLFYNKTAFEEAGVALPPTTWTSEGWTWDDFLSAAQALNIPDERWGALIYDETSYEQTFTINNGEPSGIWSEDGTQFTMANPTGIEAIQWVTDLTCKHEVQPPWSELQMDDAGYQMFASGRVAMIGQNSSFASYLRENVSDFTWDLAPIPGKVEQKSLANLTVFCIPKDAKNPEAAFELLKFLSSTEGGRIFADAGEFVPVNKAAAAEIKAVNGMPEHINLVTEAIENSTTENFSVNIMRARQIYRSEMDLVYNCSESAENVLTGIREQVEAALAGDI